METKTKQKELKQFIKKLKEKGFQVYAPKEPSTYCYFVKNNNIGYVEYSDFGFNFSTVHKPNRSCGTGYSIYREDYKPTVNKAQDCFMYKPRWASQNDEVKKYASWNDYISSPINQIIKTIEL